MWIGGIFLIIVQLGVSSFFVNQSGQFNPVRSDFLIKIIILFVAFSFLFNNQATYYCHMQLYGLEFICRVMAKIYLLAYKTSFRYVIVSGNSFAKLIL